MTMDGAPDFAASVSASGRLRVEPVERGEAFLALRDRWRALEARDPEGTVFLSWDWLAQVFADNPERWRVLAVWHGPRLVCVLPLSYRLHWSRSRQEFQTEIEAGGRLVRSAYTGFLCEPGYEDIAVDALAEALRRQPWARMSLRYDGSRSRSAKFMSAFAGTAYSVSARQHLINNGETDTLICPRVTLPGDYETWLTNGPGKNTRQKIRRYSRRYLVSGDYTLSHDPGSALKSDIGAMLRLWMRKWAPVKGARTARLLAANYLRILTTASRLGLLYLPVLRCEGRVIGALGHILDPRMKRVHFILAGRDETVTGNFIGPLLHSQAIGWAIDRGYEVYDFGHGNEAYKFNFGAQPETVSSFSIVPRSLPGPVGVLDPICRPQALARLLSFVGAGEVDSAAAGCKQLLQLERAGTDLRSALADLP